MVSELPVSILGEQGRELGRVDNSLQHVVAEAFERGTGLRSAEQSRICITPNQRYTRTKGFSSVNSELTKLTELYTTAFCQFCQFAMVLVFESLV